MKRRTLPAAILAFALCAASSGAAAFDSGIYAGASAGSSEYDAPVQVDNATGFKATLGFASGTLQVNGANLSLVGRIPVSDSFSFHAKVGYFSGDAKASGPGGRASGTGSDPSYGVGLAYLFNPNVGVRVEYDLVGSDDPIGLASVGVVVKF